MPRFVKKKKKKRSEEQFVNKVQIIYMQKLRSTRKVTFQGWMRGLNRLQRNEDVLRVQ